MISIHNTHSIHTTMYMYMQFRKDVFQTTHMYTLKKAGHLLRICVKYMLGQYTCTVYMYSIVDIKP